MTTQTDSWRLRDDRVAARRGIALKSIEALGADASEAELCRRAVRTIAADAEELPFAMVYLVAADGRHARLAASVGVEEGTRWTPRHVDFEAGDGWPIEHVVSTGEPVDLAQLEQRFGARPEGLPAIRSARLLPVRVRSTDRVRAVLVVGIGASGEHAGAFLRAAAERVAGALTRAAVRAQEKAARAVQSVLPFF